MNRPLRLTACCHAAMLVVLAACHAPAYQTADHYPSADPPRTEAPDARNPAQYQEDASITTRVQAAVLGVPGVHANNIQVSTYEGVVTLRGTVSNEAAAHNAVQAARQVTGVRSVDFDLRVRPN